MNFHKDNENKSEIHQSISKLRKVVTATVVVVVSVILALFLFGLIYVEYNRNLDYVSTQLVNSVDQIQQTHIQELTNILESQDKKDNNAERIKNKNNVVKLGNGIQYEVPYVPIVVYKINYTTQTLDLINQQSMITLDDESVSLMSSQIKDIDYSLQVDRDSSICYQKVNTRLGDYIAFTDITSINNHIKGVMYTFAMFFIIIVVVLFAITFYLSKMLVKPVLDAWNRQEQFISNASHELKTPLSVITANSSLIDEVSMSVDEIKHWNTISLEESKRMKVLIDDMLYLASHKEPVKDSDCYIDKIIDKVCMQFEALAYQKNIEINIDKNISNDAKINASKQDLERLFGILIDNAIKYAHNDTKIKVEINSYKKKVEIKISDYGEIIEPGSEDLIFDRFYRADKARSGHEGYGLGLTMAKDIVLKHNGDIRAYTNDDGWTTFIVKFEK